VATKRAGIAIGSGYPYLGVGPGGFNAALSEARASGTFPLHLPDYDPRSTFTGAFAETGLIGFVLLLVLLYALWYMSTALVEPRDVECVVAFLLFLLIGSVSLDVTNHRYLWVAVGIVYGLSPSQNGAVRLPSDESREKRTRPA